MAPTAAPKIAISRLPDTTDGNDQFRIQWDALGANVDGTGDDSSNAIDGYRVEWYSDPGYVIATADPPLDTSDWPDEETSAPAQILAEGTPSTPGQEYTVVHNMVDSDQTFLTPGATYYYRVRAEAGDLAGKWSNVVSMRAAFNAPVLPTVVTTEPAGTTSIKVSWTAPASNGGTPITSYDVQVRTATTAELPTTNHRRLFDGSGTSLIEKLPANNTSYIHRGVRRGAALFYYYRVRANNAATDDKGKGAWSDITATGMRPSAASVGTPGVPDTPNATNDAGTVTFGWLVPDSAGDSPITGYEIQYQRDDDKSDEGLE